MMATNAAELNADSIPIRMPLPAELTWPLMLIIRLVEAVAGMSWDKDPGDVTDIPSGDAGAHGAMDKVGNGNRCNGRSSSCLDRPKAAITPVAMRCDGGRHHGQSRGGSTVGCGQSEITPSLVVRTSDINQMSRKN